MTTQDQWVRKIGLYVAKRGADITLPDVALDLSAFRIHFTTTNADVESPNSCSIRVYNLSRQTIKEIQGEFSKVVLNAGYEGGNYGVIFQGTIKQFKIGRENNIDSYLDIYAADGDIAYNQGIVNASLAAGATPLVSAQTAAAAMPGADIDTKSLTITRQNIPNLRGSVLLGMARARIRDITSYLDAGWSIQNGTIIMTDNTGYREGTVVKINSATGLIGVPEQTDQGIRVTCLLNSKIRIGGRVELNNAEIAQLMQQNDNAAPIAYNQWAGFQYLAAIGGKPDGDGAYRAFVVEHEGDSRGHQWYTTLTCLAINETVAANVSVQGE